MSSSTSLTILLELRDHLRKQEEHRMELRWLEEKYNNQLMPSPSLTSYFRSCSESCTAFHVLRREVDAAIKNACSHVYEEDYIDHMSGDSQKITYCIVCESTF